MNAKQKSWTSLILYVLTIAVNFAGASGMINGLSQKDVSDQYMTLITPAPFAFSIWGLIYLLVFLSILLMIKNADRIEFGPIIHAISFPFWLTCIFSMAWIVAFSYVQLGISVLIIFAYLVALTVIDRELLRRSDSAGLVLPLTFGIYTGWLVIATTVNISAFLVQLGWNGFGIAPNIWAMIILTVAIFLVGFFQIQLRNAVLPLPVAWAYFAIHQFLTSENGFNGAYPTLEIVSLIGAVVLVGFTIYTFYRNRRLVLPVRYNTPL